MITAFYEPNLFNPHLQNFDKPSCSAYNDGFSDEPSFLRNSLKESDMCIGTPKVGIPIQSVQFPLETKKLSFQANGMYNVNRKSKKEEEENAYSTDIMYVK